MGDTYMSATHLMPTRCGIDVSTTTPPLLECEWMPGTLPRMIFPVHVLSSVL